MEHRLPKVLSIEEVELLLRQPDTSNPLVSEIGYVKLLYATGMRVSELISISIEDVNLEMGYLRYWQRSKERIVPIGSVAIHYLKIT